VGDDTESAELLNVNALQLSLVAQRFIAQIFRSPRAIPIELRDICRHIQKTVAERFPDATLQAIGAFIFLRFFNAAIAVPESYGLVKQAPSEGVRRSLLLVTKIMSTLSSGAHFGEKEAFMTQFNELLDNNRAQLASYYEVVVFLDQEVTANRVPIPRELYDKSLSFIAEKAARMSSSSSSTSYSGL
jgi:neurofibromin 1